MRHGLNKSVAFLLKEMLLSIVLVLFYYFLVGFVVATVAIRLEPPSDEDKLSLFLFAWAIGPVVAAIFFLVKPLNWYVNYITK